MKVFAITLLIASGIFMFLAVPFACTKASAQESSTPSIRYNEGTTFIRVTTTGPNNVQVAKHNIIALEDIRCNGANVMYDLADDSFQAKMVDRIMEFTDAEAQKVGDIAFVGPWKVKRVE